MSSSVVVTDGSTFCNRRVTSAGLYPSATSALNASAWGLDRRRARAGRSANLERLTGRQHLQAIAHFDDEPLRRLAANARNAREGRGILRLHAAVKLVHAGTGKDAERNAGTDAGNLDELAEETPFAFGAETKQDVSVLAHDEMRVQHDVRADGWQAIERRHRRLDFVADATHIQQQHGRMLRGQSTAQKADQGCAPSSAIEASTAWRVPREYAWHRASPIASAASGPSSPLSLSSDITMS